jgi:hypothetical protein
MSELEQLLQGLKSQTIAINNLCTVICRLAESTHDLAIAVAGDGDEENETGFYMDGTSVKTNDN